VLAEMPMAPQHRVAVAVAVPVLLGQTQQLLAVLAVMVYRTRLLALL
jgi:hypothetical protein